MNKLERFLVSIKNRYFGWISPDPDPKKIDKTGLIRSDHPVEGNGWIKGWVVDVPAKDIIIVCKHAGPSSNPPNNKVYVVDKFGTKFERTITKVDYSPYNLNGKESNLTFRGEENYFLGGDIAICKVDEPFPDTIKAYKFSINPKILQKKAYTYNQHNELTTARIFYSETLAWIFGKGRFGEALIGGDSGTVWFVWDGDWKIATHTTKGYAGEGPYYGHKFIYDELLKNINSL